MIVRPSSERKAIQLLRMHPRMSRGQLAAHLNVTRAGIARIVAELNRMGLVRESQPKARGDRGRPSRRVELNPSGLFGLGVSIEFDRIQVALVNLRHELLEPVSWPNPFLETSSGDVAAADDLAHRISDYVHQVLLRQGDGDVQSRLAGAMMTAAGCVSYERPDHFNNVNSGGATAQVNRLADSLHRHLGESVGAICDADAALLAERWMGVDIPSRPNLVYVNDLLGFALLVNGRPATSLMQPGRWLGNAHMTREAHPERLTMENCLAVTASRGGMLDLMDGTVYGHRTPPSRSTQDYLREIPAFYQKYHQGDPKAHQIIRRGFEDIALALRNLSMLLRIDQIVLKGWTPALLNDGMVWMRAVLESVPYGSPALRLLAPKLRPASLGDRQEVAGAALAAIDHGLTNARLMRLSQTAPRVSSVEQAV